MSLETLKDELNNLGEAIRWRETTVRKSSKHV